MSQQVNIEGRSFTLVIDSNVLGAVLTGLGELPGKISHVAMSVIENQVANQVKEMGLIEQEEVETSEEEEKEEE